MENQKMKKYLASFVRHGLTFLGGVLVAKGVVDKETADATAEAIAGPTIEVLAGVISAGVGQLLSIKHLAKILPYIPKF